MEIYKYKMTWNMNSFKLWQCGSTHYKTSIDTIYGMV